MCVITDGSERPIPQGATKLTDNSVSIVWRGNDGWIYKRSLPFLIENEEWCLRQMFGYGFTPTFERYDKYTLRINDLGKSEPVTNVKAFRLTCKHMLACLQKCNIRHGDLTEYAIIVKDNWPFLIDFAESRLSLDPRPDKRAEGDEYWLRKTVTKLCSQAKSA